MFSPRSADTYTKEWPSGGDQGPVLDLGPFGSVPLQRSVKGEPIADGQSSVAVLSAHGFPPFPRRADR